MIYPIFIFGQTPEQKYNALIKKADVFYRIKNYKNSALTYSLAFNIKGHRPITKDRFNAACSWALANYPDSAFSQLKCMRKEICRRINVDTTPKIDKFRSTNSKNKPENSYF